MKGKKSLLALLAIKYGVLGLSCWVLSFGVSGETKIASPQLLKFVVKMKNDEGQIKRFSEANADEIASIVLFSERAEEQLQWRSKLVDCEQKKVSAEAEADYLLELPLVIESLRNDKIPQLSDSQRKTLSKIPLCPPYLIDLKIIALQLAGWKLEERVMAEAKR